MAVEIAPKVILEVTVLPLSLQLDMSQGSNAKFRVVSYPVKLVKELDESHRQATGIRAIYTDPDGPLNYHVTDLGYVTWGNDRMVQPPGIWGLGARVENGVLAYIEARIR